MKKKSVYFASSAAILTLVLSACGGSSSGSKLSDVEYTMNGSTAQPSVAAETPFAATGTEAYKIEDGQGEAIQDGDNLLVDATVFSGEDLTSVASTYTEAPMIIPVGEQLKAAAPELYDLLKGSKVGVAFSYSTNIDAQSTSTAEATPTVSPGTATNLEVYTVTGKLLKEATGEDTKLNSPILKEFSAPEGSAATLTLADDRGDAPTELKSEEMIKGDGAVVAATDTVYVNYVGVKWSDGEQFDGNFGASPINFKLNSVIEGWQKGLEGKTVGSRVLLQIPSEMAYGEDTGETGQPAGALVFVVDILATSPERTAPSASATPSAEATATSSETANQ
ncbi:FKBP-type peptidyl-prolyl cis-trans isomerase [Rothia nasimurium]|uniref:FKBP-type peptidyl-prolyl cis-trans isomerase n=1 Tax=Rothia nasimurium TaxID=85336 RepID=UPI001F0150D1|nr:FKBP-type peptidyl-prolyl cis-trans isomerase [Rothia nasimurium]